VCCSVLQCVAVCCSVLQCVAVCCSVLQCVAVCCSVFQCVAVVVYKNFSSKVIMTQTGHIYSTSNVYYLTSKVSCVVLQCKLEFVLHCVLQCVL